MYMSSWFTRRNKFLLGIFKSYDFGGEPLMIVTGSSFLCKSNDNTYE